MIEIFIRSNNILEKRQLFRIEINDLDNVQDSDEILKESISNHFGLDANEFEVLSENGIKIRNNFVLKNEQTFQICPKVMGGKGGFGSLLRAFGKQITMSTNKDACRDLTGRRIKHVNNEKKIKEFLSKQGELAKQKDLEAKERSERRKKKREQIDSKHHIFVDPKYDEQKQKITQDLEDALKIAAGKKVNKEGEVSPSTSEEKSSDESEKEENSTNGKKSDSGSDKSENESSTKSVVLPTTSIESKSNPVLAKKDKPKDLMFKDWMGVGDLDVSSSSDEEEQPAKSNNSNNLISINLINKIVKIF